MTTEIAIHPTLEELVPAFVRAFGLHRPLHTPCGVAVSVAEAHTLTALHSERLSQQALATRLQLEKSTVSRLITHMEQQGWVERSTDSADTRVRYLGLTAAGQKLALEVMEARSAKFARMLARLSAVEHDQIVTALQRLVEVTHD